MKVRQLKLTFSASCFAKAALNDRTTATCLLGIFLRCRRHSLLSSCRLYLTWCLFGIPWQTWVSMLWYASCPMQICRDEIGPFPGLFPLCQEGNWTCPLYNLPLQIDGQHIQGLHKPKCCLPSTCGHIKLFLLSAVVASHQVFFPGRPFFCLRSPSRSLSAAASALCSPPEVPWALPAECLHTSTVTLHQGLRIFSINLFPAHSDQGGHRALLPSTAQVLQCECWLW